ncbi:MAG: hypothetical protein WC637_04810 [Victivallales bacterium]|jgi:outer membrane murein-binding lipoprotein Lpp
MKINVLTVLGIGVIAGAVFLAGCDNNSEVGEKTGAKIDTAAEKTKDALNTAADKTAEGVKKAVTATKDATSKAVEKTGEALGKAGAAVEKTGTDIQK